MKSNHSEYHIKQMAAGLCSWRNGKKSNIPFEELSVKEQQAYMDQAKIALDIAKDIFKDKNLNIIEIKQTEAFKILELDDQPANTTGDHLTDEQRLTLLEEIWVHISNKTHEFR